ncbi:hypothetical protein KKP97_04610 [Methanothermococcus sp. SCGC AD-155-C09]|nr:hypothetical protein [Methanothermococcus sp. SCGC AD-155-C09]
MSGKCIYKVIKHLSEEELNRKIREQKDAALLKKGFYKTPLQRNES